MEKRFSTLVGITLIFLGSLALLFNLIMPMLGFDGWRWGVWRLWPLIVVGIGWLFVLLPFLVHGWRGLGGLFIPGIPILVTGSILFLASFFNWWGVGVAVAAGGTRRGAGFPVRRCLHAVDLAGCSGHYHWTERVGVAILRPDRSVGVVVSVVDG